MKRERKRDANGLTASDRYKLRQQGIAIPKLKPGPETKNPVDWIKRGGPDECWLWFGRLNPWGYGVFTRNGRTTRAHRAMWEIENGPIPDGMILLHSCDVRACCNPRHLTVGTHAENRFDTVKKNRHAKGNCMAAAKLDDEKVRQIRARYASGETHKTRLANEYGVTRKVIINVVNRQSWRHVE